MKNESLIKQKTFAFRQWSRKRFAVFNSLKLVIKISVMSVAYTLINPQETKAQGDTAQSIKTVELDDVEVSGQRAPVVSSQMVRVVSVVTRSEVAQAPSLSVDNLLKYVPQVDIRQRGVNGSQADISIQGGSFDQTLILLNGVNLTDPQTGHYNLTLPIDLESIDRIEILKGPSTRVFGPNAFSGAVNFVTGQDHENYVKVSQLAGDFGVLRSSATLNQHNRRFHNLLSVSQNQSDGYIHNTDYKFKNVFYHGKVFLDKSNVGVQLGYTMKKLGANSFYSPSFPNQYDKTDTYFGSINAETGSTVKISPVVYWRRNYDHYVLNYLNPKMYQNFHQTDVYGAGINATRSSSFGKTSLGMDYRKEMIYSTGLGTPKTPKSIPGQDSIKYTLGDQRENISAFLEQNFYLGRFSASVGLMANHNTKLNGINFYPGADIGYKITHQLKWYTSVNRSLRMPSFTDLYYKGRQNIGNANLKPERAWTLETGLKYAWPVAQGNLSYFYRWGRDMIDWVKAKDSLVWHTMNYTKLDVYGVEFAVTIKPREIIDGLSLIKEINLSYSYTGQNKNSDTLDSYYALDHLKHKLVVGINHTIWRNIGATWQFLWQDRNGMYSDYKRYDPLTKTSPLNPYKSFALFDGRIYYSNRNLKVFVEASNIFNESYMDIGNIAQPSRWFKIGLELKIGI